MKKELKYKITKTYSHGSYWYQTWVKSCIPFCWRSLGLFDKEKDAKEAIVNNRKIQAYKEETVYEGSGSDL